MGERQNVKALMVKDITADPGIQPRAKGLTDDVVEEYAAAMTDGREFPPVVVYRDPATGTHWLAQGFHRLAAAVKAGRKKIPAEVRPGTRRDALIDAAGSNALHGLRRTNPDKRRAVELLLAECPDWSNRRIADAAGVGDDLVADVRKTVRKDVNQVSDSDTSSLSEDKVIGSDGKSYGPKHEAPKAAGGGQVTTVTGAGDTPSGGGSESSGEGGEGSAGGGSAEPSGGTPGPAGVTAPETHGGGQEADPAASFVATVDVLCRDMDQIAARVEALKVSPYGYAIHVDSAADQVKAARKTVWQGRPAHACPYCQATGCKVCNNTGRVKRATYDRGVEAVGGLK